MKKFVLLALVAVAVTSCKQNNKEQENLLEQQRDSLTQIIQQKDNEINDVIGTLNDIEEGFREITEAQGRVAVAKAGEGANPETRIRENMQFIQSTMQQNRELINKLRMQLRSSSINGEQLKRTLENLTAQLAEKEQMLQQLRAELDAKDIHIAELDETIADLHQDVASLKDEGTKKDATIDTQDKQLNTAWFVFGTKKRENPWP